MQHDSRPGTVLGSRETRCVPQKTNTNTITGHPTALPPIPEHMDSLGKVLVFNITEL